MRSEDPTIAASRARERQKRIIFGCLMLTLAVVSALLIFLTIGWQSSLSWTDDFVFSSTHIPFFVFCISSLLAVISFSTALDGDHWDIMHDKLNELGVELYRSSSGRNIHVFRSRGRIVYIHVIRGDDNDTTGNEALLLTSQDVLFDSDHTEIMTREIMGQIMPEDEQTPLGDEAFDQHFILSTDNLSFARTMLTPEVQTSLLALEKYSPNIEFSTAKRPLVDRLTASPEKSAEMVEQTYCNFTIDIYGWPQTDADMDTFIDLSLTLLHATTRPEHLIDAGKPSLQSSRQHVAEPLPEQELVAATHKVRSRRFSLGMGLVLASVALFSGIFISVTSGISGWKLSLSWLDGFDFTADHVPFFFFLVPALGSLLFLGQARQGYRLLPVVTAAPGYIDFDKIRRRWPQRFRDKVSFDLRDFLATLVFFVLLGGVVWLLLRVIGYFTELLF